MAQMWGMEMKDKGVLRRGSESHFWVVKNRISMLAWGHIFGGRTVVFVVLVVCLILTLY